MGKIRNGIDWPRFKAKYPNMREPCFGMAFCVTGKFPRIVRMEFRRIFLDALFSRMAVAGGWYDCSPPADGLRARHGPRMDLGPSASNRLRKSARDGRFDSTAVMMGQERKDNLKWSATKSGAEIVANCLARERRWTLKSNARAARPSTI